MERKQMHRELSHLPKVTQLVSAELRPELRQVGSRVCALNPYTILPLTRLGYLSCLKFTFLLYEMGTLAPTSCRKVEDKTRARTYGQALTQGLRVAGI